MAKTNLLAQNDDLVIENLKADVGKSVMNLSHSVTFPIDVDGAILPICCIETLPSDSFEISVEVLLRQLTPLKVPLMTNLRLNTAFYYCDNRLAWKKWERFMTGGRSGDELYDIPRLANIRYPKQGTVYNYGLADKIKTDAVSFTHINYKTTLHTYFGVSLNKVYDDLTQFQTEDIDFSDECPVAFPFFDYQMICRDYYTNVDRLPQTPKQNYTDYGDLDCDWSYENLFPSDDDEIRLVDGIQFRSGFQSGDDPTQGFKGFLLDKVRYHDVRDDYFTTSKKAPMRGTPPALTAQSSLTLPNGTQINLTNKDGEALVGQLALDPEVHVVDAELTVHHVNPVDNTQNDLYSSSVGSKDVELRYNRTGDDPRIIASTDPITGISGVTYNDVVLQGLLQANWTAADIRLLSQLSVWQELNMLHEPYYNDFLNAHFDNVRVGESPVEKPQYIGGTSQIISINEILQTSQTTDTSSLGQQGATAMSLAQNFVGRYYCNNYGYIIGVCYIIPDLLYKPAMPRHFSRRTKEDYYSPEFANLSMQATLNKEIFFSDDPDWNNSPWGYTGAYDELRSIPNRIAGDLLNSDYQDIQHWVLTREMSNDNKPSMSHTWLSLKDNVDTQAWWIQYEPETTIPFPKFMLQAANYVKAVRPMPKIAIPKAL